MEIRLVISDLLHSRYMEIRFVIFSLLPYYLGG
ncbi:hypothetical protein F383_11202 [Gossypium arboreum]|uniref:Uncharacterized protein n=1 Tax=Gossypium arboreum TaxID=29729 RepID=A0A0B0NFG4_GOSAR|nr:hypothetical protein F383_11202 [Gossypium arboreum]